MSCRCVRSSVHRIEYADFSGTGFRRLGKETILLFFATSGQHGLQLGFEGFLESLPECSINQLLTNYFSL